MDKLQLRVLEEDILIRREKFGEGKLHGHGGKKWAMKIFLICTQHHVFLWWWSGICSTFRINRKFL